MRTTMMVAGLALMAFATPAAAQNTSRGFAGGDQDGGVHANTILGIPISPRAVGVGEAMGTIDRDPSVLWYNAAGLVGLRNNAFTINGAQRFGQTQLVGVAAAFPTEIAAFGVGIRAFNAGTVQSFREGEPTGGNVRAYQWVLEGGGALQLARWWRWGGTLYFAQENLADQNAGTVGINSGMQFPEIFGRLSLAGGFRNWGTNSNVNESGPKAKPPLSGYAGAGCDLFRQRNLMQTPMLFRGQPIIVDAKLMAQGFVPDQDEPYVGFGIEGTVNGVVIGRIGYQTGNDNRKGISLGAGVNVGQFRLEYAFRDYQNGGAKFFSNDPAGDAHNVSFSYFWGEKERNQPVVPIVVTQPIDTAALNAAIRDALERQMAELRPLLDSLRSRQVEISQSDLVAKYIVPVHFAFDSATVRDTDMVVLGQIADVIKRVYPTALVTIEGFADPAGSVDYNNKLSKRRAEAVRDVMVNRFGLPERQFKTVGYGKSANRQVNPGARKDEPGAEKNRRVTFTIDATQRF